MMIEVSNGELLDKVTILSIKREEIRDTQKLLNIENEYAILLTAANNISSSEEVQKLVDQLREVNYQLWRIEDSIREKERKAAFDSEFIQLARSVYFTNDKRAALKKQIDRLTNSTLTEEKSYEQY